MTDETNVVHLVVLCDGNVAAVGDHVPDFGDSELGNLGGEGEVVPEALDAVGHQVLEALVEPVVLRLHVRVLDGFGQDVLVKRPDEVDIEISKEDDLEMTLPSFLPGEVALEELVVVNGLGNHPADKLEVVEVVGVGL